jgi:RND family efflux transporter MFP subunit
MWRRLLFIPPLALGIAVLMLTVANRPAPARKPPAETVMNVRVLTIRALPFQPRITGYGTVRPDKIWNAVAQVGGKVVFVHPRLKKGEIIEKGEEIITISPEDYRLAIAQAEAAIRGAEAKLEELAVTERNTRELLRLEREALQVTEKDYRRKLSLQKSGTVPPAVVEQALKALVAQRKLVQTLENTLRLIPVQRRELEEQLAAYRAQLATARLNLERTHIRMPFTGRISKVAVEVEQFAPVGMLLASADSINAAEIEAQYPLSRMRALISLLGAAPADITLTPRRIRELIATLGLKVEVRLQTDGPPVVWKGRFARLSDTFDPRTRTIGIIGEVSDPYGHVTPGRRPPLTKGMFVRMDVLSRPVEKALIIPRLALRQGHVYVADAENRLRLRKVKVRARFGDLLVIDKGLSPGERVVLSDIVPALAGQLLAPVEDEAMARRLRRLAAGEH